MFRMIPSSIIRSTFKLLLQHLALVEPNLLPSADVEESETPTPPRQWTVANTVRTVPDVVNTVWMCSWWWMRISSETCRALCKKYNKTIYSGILLDNYWLLMVSLGKPLFLHQVNTAKIHASKSTHHTQDNPRHELDNFQGSREKK